MKRLVVSAFIGTCFFSPTFAQHNNQELERMQLQETKYMHCIALSQTKPAIAKKIAQNIKENIGEEAANHCLGVALINLGQHKKAASLLTKTAENSKLSDPELLANMFAQAANAWIIAGNDTQALELLNRAITLVPEEPDYLIDRAVALALQNKYWESLDDLNEVISMKPERVDALTFRANAWRKVGSIELAAQDIKKALELKPNYPEALLESGLINAEQGNKAAARADWTKIVKFNVSKPLTIAAKKNLQKLHLPLLNK